MELPVLSWKHIDEHPKEFMNGDEYLVAVPVSKNSSQNFRYEYHHLTVVADEEICYFNDVNGDFWGAWAWEDIEYYAEV